MRPTPVAVLFVLALLAPVALGAQSQPDFSGRWVLVDPEPTGLAAQSLGVHQERVVANVYGKPIPPAFSGIKISRSFRDHRQTDDYSIGVLGGTVEGGVVGSTEEPPPDNRPAGTRWSVRWEGSDLVIETSDLADDTDRPPTREHREVWHLDRGGRLIVTATDRSHGGEAVVTTLTYRRVRN